MTSSAVVPKRINNEAIDFPHEHQVGINVPPWQKPVRCRQLESPKNQKKGHRSARRCVALR
jgi:hypothetical protein